MKEWCPETNSYIDPSKEIFRRAAEEARLIKDKTAAVESHNDREVWEVEDVITELKSELTAKEAAIKGLVEENAMLEKRTITIQQGKQDEIDGWRGKLAKANIELDRLRRNEYNRNAFAEAGK